VAPAGGGDVGVTRPSMQADDGVTQGGHDLGCVADADLGTVLVDVTSRPQCSLFSMLQCPRIHAVSSRAGAASAGTEQITQTTSALYVWVPSRRRRRVVWATTRNCPRTASGVYLG